MKFNEKLQMLRKEKGLSQEGFAEILNVSRQAVSKWESGVSYPEMEKMISISDIFGVTVDSLAAAIMLPLREKCLCRNCEPNIFIFSEGLNVNG